MAKVRSLSVLKYFTMNGTVGHKSLRVFLTSRILYYSNNVDSTNFFDIFGYTRAHTHIVVNVIKLIRF